MTQPEYLSNSVETLLLDSTDFTVLVVDDSPIDRVMASRILQADDELHILEASDGEQALTLIAEESPDLVITDMQMPRLGGIELLETICQQYSDIPVILITSRGSEQIAVKALESGATSYVPKTRLAEDLLSTVRRVLMNRRSQKLASTVKNCLVATESHYQLRNDPEHLIAAADVLTEAMAATWQSPIRELGRIRMTLEEALLNAMYHGNLEMNPRVREMNLKLYHELSKSRVSQTPYCNRMISVRVGQTDDMVSWEISDEGPGFDAAAFLNTEEVSMLERPYGRGILLMRTVMDEVAFNEKGNSVCLTRYRGNLTASNSNQSIDESDDLPEAGFVFAIGDDE